MFTQQAPALVKALRDVLTPEQLEQLTSSLGNCQQPLAHRGAVHISPAPNMTRNNRGVYGPGAWDPARYPGLVPNAGNQGLYDIGGMDPPVWNTGNKYSSAFSFPTDQYFSQNQFFGGPQVYMSQGARIENIFNDTFQGDSILVNNINVQQLNGQPLPGPAGPPGAVGQQGRPGAPGQNGIDRLIPVGKFRPLKHLVGNRPNINFFPRVIPARVADIWVREAVPTAVPTAVTFDPENCSVSFSATETVYTVAASTAERKRLSAVILEALIAGTPVPPITIAGADYGTEIQVQAKIQGINPAQALVFQQ